MELGFLLVQVFMAYNKNNLGISLPKSKSCYYSRIQITRTQNLWAQENLTNPMWKYILVSTLYEARLKNHFHSLANICWTLILTLFSFRRPVLYLSISRVVCSCNTSTQGGEQAKSSVILCYSSKFDANLGYLSPPPKLSTPQKYPSQGANTAV